MTNKIHNVELNPAPKDNVTIPGKTKGNGEFPYDDLLKPDPGTEMIAGEAGKASQLNIFMNARATDKDGNKLPLKAKPILDTKNMKHDPGQANQPQKTRMSENRPAQVDQRTQGSVSSDQDEIRAGTKQESAPKHVQESPQIGQKQKQIARSQVPDGLKSGPIAEKVEPQIPKHVQQNELKNPQPELEQGARARTETSELKPPAVQAVQNASRPSASATVSAASRPATEEPEKRPVNGQVKQLIIDTKISNKESVPANLETSKTRVEAGEEPNMKPAKQTVVALDTEAGQKSVEKKQAAQVPHSRKIMAKPSSTEKLEIATAPVKVARSENSIQNIETPPEQEELATAKKTAQVPVTPQPDLPRQSPVIRMTKSKVVVPTIGKQAFSQEVKQPDTPTQKPREGDDQRVIAITRSVVAESQDLETVINGEVAPAEGKIVEQSSAAVIFAEPNPAKTAKTRESTQTGNRSIKSTPNSSLTEHFRAKQAERNDSHTGIGSIPEKLGEPLTEDPADLLKQQLQERIEILKKAQNSMTGSQDQPATHNLHRNMSMQVTPGASFTVDQPPNISFTKTSAALFARNFASEMVEKIRLVTESQTAGKAGTLSKFVVDGGQMGQLDIEFQSASNKEQIIVFVDNENSRNELLRLMPQIDDNLRQRGFNFSGLDVEVRSDQKESGSANDAEQNATHSKTQESSSSAAGMSNDNESTTNRNYGYNTMEVIA